MTRRENYMDGHNAYVKGLVILEQFIKLTAVGFKILACVKYVAKHTLYLGNMLTNSNFSPYFFSQIWSRRKVIRVSMGF